jgi:hypothetical protein
MENGWDQEILEKTVFSSKTTLFRWSRRIEVIKLVEDPSEFYIRWPLRALVLNYYGRISKRHALDPSLGIKHF